MVVLVLAFVPLAHPVGKVREQRARAVVNRHLGLHAVNHPAKDHARIHTAKVDERRGDGSLVLELKGRRVARERQEVVVEGTLDILAFHRTPQAREVVGLVAVCRVDIGKPEASVAGGRAVVGDRVGVVRRKDVACKVTLCVLRHALAVDETLGARHCCLELVNLLGVVLAACLLHVDQEFVLQMLVEGVVERGVGGEHRDILLSEDAIAEELDEGVLARAAVLGEHLVHVAQHHAHARFDAGLLDHLCEDVDHELRLSAGQLGDVGQDGFDQRHPLLLRQIQFRQVCRRQAREEVVDVRRALPWRRDKVHAVVLTAVGVVQPDEVEGLLLDLVAVPDAELAVGEPHPCLVVRHERLRPVVVEVDDATADEEVGLLELLLHGEILLVVVLVDERLEDLGVLLLAPPVERPQRDGFVDLVMVEGGVDVEGFAFSILRTPATELVEKLPRQLLVVQRQSDLDPVAVLLGVLQVDRHQELADVLLLLADGALGLVHLPVLALDRLLDALHLLGVEVGREEAVDVVEDVLGTLGDGVGRIGQVAELVVVGAVADDVVRGFDVEQGVLVADVQRQLLVGRGPEFGTRLEQVVRALARDLLDGACLLAHVGNLSVVLEVRIVQVNRHDPRARPRLQGIPRRPLAAHRRISPTGRVEGEHLLLGRRVPRHVPAHNLPAESVVKRDDVHFIHYRHLFFLTLNACILPHSF